MADPTKRDLLQRVKVNGEDIAHYCAAIFAGTITKETFETGFNGNVADIQAAMAAYPDAEP